MNTTSCVYVYTQCCRFVDLLPKSVDFKTSLVTERGVVFLWISVDFSVDFLTSLWISKYPQDICTLIQTRDIMRGNKNV